MATMTTMNSKKHLKMRRHAAPCLVNPCANPQDLADVECGKEALLASVVSVECDSADDHAKDRHKKDDDHSVLGRRAADFLADLSPFSRRLVRLVTPPRPSVPGRRATAALTVAALRLVPALTALLALPLLIWDGYPADWSALHPLPLLRHLDRVWSSLLHTSLWPIAAATCLAVALRPWALGGASRSATKGSAREGPAALLAALAAGVARSGWRTSAALSLFFSAVVIGNMTLHMGYPHALWNPFIWGWYRVYLPGAIAPALRGACLDLDAASAARQPLCLSEREWNELSSGRLSSYSPDDVLAVQRGLEYLQRRSGGIVINALARNVADSIPALRQNVEGLAPFFADSLQQKLSVVVFENDSDDGTRARFRDWADEVARAPDPRYAVDLMSCGPQNPNCELGLLDRYDMNLLTHPKASGVGKLGEFRQIALEYILGQERYRDYSHMVILDVDLGTSLSPLGLLHTLGLEDDRAQRHVVASSSSQVWPGTSGTIIPPYDLSAFRPQETVANARVRAMHGAFCDLMPAGDRWRNMCEACSPMQLFMIQAASDPTVHHGRAYPVESAFNGLALYPLDLLRDRGAAARYDAGDDGQRCEHVGFHLALGRPVYVNPKWSMNLKPSNPGGPTGFKAIKTLVTAVVGRPNVMLCVVVGNFVFFYVVVYAWWTIATSVKVILGLQGWS